MRFHLLPFLLSVLAASALGAATVTSVKVRATDGLGGDMSDVQAQCLVKPGSTYDPVTCARDVRTLRDSRDFDTVVVEAAPDGDGIAVTYLIRRKMRFKGPLAVKGNDFWGAGKIAKLADLRDGSSVDDADLAAAALRVRTAYQKKFFPDVQVKVSTDKIPDSGGAVNVTFEITEGPRVKIHDFKFLGNPSVPAKDLRASFGQYPWWNPFGWFTDTPATANDLDAARETVLGVYRDRGFLDAAVTGPERVARPDGKSDMCFTVKEGPRYTVGAVTVSGTKLFPAESVAKADLSAKPGDVAGAAAIAKASHEVELYYGGKGYADTRVDVRRIANLKDPTVLDLDFAVTEGVPVDVNEVKIRGNDRTKDKVIRREIRLSPGDPMLEDKAEQAQKRLENLRYFERVRYYLEKVEGGEAKDGHPERRDLVYEVAEKSTGNFGVGIGASSVDSVYGTVELSEANFDIAHPWRFSGGGQKARAAVQVGPRVQTYEASVTEPWFLDRPLEFTVEGYRRMRWYDQYDVTRSGGDVSLSYPVKFWPSQRHAFGRLGIRGTIEYVEMSDVDDGLWSHKRGETDTDAMTRLFKHEEDEYDGAVEAPVRLYWADDSRDNFLVPTRGHSALLYGDLCAGDNEYWRLGVNYGQYFTVVKKWQHVFSFRVRGETIDAMSGDLPIYDRLFLGGPRSIRGVDYREIAPKVYSKDDHAPWGGKTLFCITSEYTVPVVKYVRLAAFTDLGSVGADAFDPDFSNYFCWSVGAGLRLDIPNFPIRLDLAVPVTEPDDVDKQVFSFVIGYDY